jgi:hypothetical protein
MAERPLLGQFQVLPEALMSLPFDERKDRSRRQFLIENPAQRLQVDTSRLLSIIDFVAFKCHRNSSIARNVAIRGSDIDAGLVVLREEIPVEKELAFIGELRGQGFDVYHPTEVATLRRQIENPSLSCGQKLDLIRRSTAAEYNKISFVPERVLQLQGPDLGVAYQIYVEGFAIA